MKEIDNNTSASRYAAFLRNLPKLGAFSLGLVLTISGVVFNEYQYHRQVIEHGAQDAAEYRRRFQDGIEAYVRLNHDVAGLFTASGDVTPQEFSRYIRSVKAFKLHPGLGHIGYIPRVPNFAAGKFEANLRKAFPSYKIHGTQEGFDSVYPLLYGLPSDQCAAHLAGFDFSGSPRYWEAMQLARDSGTSIATENQAYSAEPLGQSVIFIFTPVYVSDGPLETNSQRREALTGFIYSSFRVDKAIGDIMGGKFKTLFDLKIYEGSPNAQSALLYASNDGNGNDNRSHTSGADSDPIAYTEDSEFAGRKWSLHFYPKPAYFKKYANSNDRLIVLSGILLSFALAFLTGIWQRQRRLQRLQLEHGQRFQAVFENHPSAVYSLDTQRRFINANAKALEKFAIGKARLMGMSIDQFIVPDNLQRTKELFQEVLKGNAVTYDNAIITSTGKRLEVSVVLIPVTIEGKISNVLGIAQNITEQKLTEWKLQESRQMLQLVIDNIPQRVFWKNTELYFLGCNKAFCEDAGMMHPDEIIGKSDTDLPWKTESAVYQLDDRETMRSGVAKINYEEPQLREDGSKNWLRTSKIPLMNGEGQTIGILGMYEDITERKLLEQKLEQMAHYDSLTGLPNRAFFYEHLTQAINRSKRHDSLLGLMYFDIDKFKHINDSYGHDVGDRVITQFAQRVKATVREIDVVGRLGGDEFCLIVEDLASRQAAETIATKLIEAMHAPFLIRETALQVSTSIGIAFHHTGMAPDELIRAADHAMYKAKQSGRNRFETNDTNQLLDQ